MIKKFLAAVFTICAVLGFTCFHVEAAQQRDWKYKTLPDGTVEIMKYSGRESEVTVPDRLGGKKVTRLGDYCFFQNKNLVRVTLTEGISSIGGYCFAENTNLARINIPGGVSSIEDYCFQNDENLLEIFLPESLVGIGQGAFGDCIGLSEISIPENVTKIGERVFSGCPRLKNIYVSGNNRYFSSKDGVLMDKKQTAVLNWPEGKAGIGEHFFDGVAKINDYAFYRCENISKADIPRGVKEIGRYAFCECTNLTEVSIPDGVTVIQDDLFAGCENLERVQLPEEISSIGDSAFLQCRKLESIHIPGTVKNIWDYAFAGSGLASIEMPDSVTLLRDLAFAGCKNLESVRLSKNLVSIGAGGFDNCSNLKNIEIPDGVRVICTDAFAGCSSLEKFDIPKSVKAIRTDSSEREFEEYFSGCKSLKAINVHKDNKAYSSVDGVLMDKKKTEIIACPPGKSSYYKVPKSVKTIGYRAFRDCVKLQGLEIRKNVTEIEGRDAFRYETDDKGHYSYGYLSSLVLGKGSYAESFAKKNGLKYKTAVYVKSLKTGKKSVTVTWNKFKKASGYQIRYSFNSDMSDYKTVNVPAEKTKKILKNLKAGKKYYIQIRAVLKDSGTGKDIYTSWSSKKSIKTR